MLVVDDDTTTTLMVQHMAKKMGITCDIAVDGAEAVRAAANCRFDFILMDIFMPVLNGLDAAREIRSASDSTVIVGLLSGDEMSLRSECVDAGMDDVALKPINTSVLRYCLRLSRLSMPQEDQDRIVECTNQITAEEEEQNVADSFPSDEQFAVSNLQDGSTNSQECMLPHTTSESLHEPRCCQVAARIGADSAHGTTQNPSVTWSKPGSGTDLRRPFQFPAVVWRVAMFLFVLLVLYQNELCLKVQTEFAVTLPRRRRVLTSSIRTLLIGQYHTLSDLWLLTKLGGQH
jgi:CheY-like chemotaxis protein